ncbi:MAG TPA: TetR/AcrR family transcriptional regulator [Aliidongia sp.]|uniref:TetR/AcrR family transcriptional regulator n=1 Tax=Aliidongia sp. TaxID=1914230 RepID=UPI002DDD14F5|nr:TetR/AcrR family transcriptional regulator [Aliidongia sp.]HEV2672935.1 TetR/AcrR family transcriptional regulator [Aliidongia sp.]
MVDDPPKWRRRKTARSGEIIDAALDVFADNGFAGAKLDEIARRAGLSKGALYLYFETKEEIFRAVVRTAVAPNLEAVRAAAEAFDGPFVRLVPMILDRMARMIGTGRLPAVVKTVIGESRNFPDLAQIWHDDVVGPAIGMLAGFVARAQGRGEVGAGDPRLYAFSLAGPVVMAMLFRETFGAVGTDLPDLPTLAQQHASVVLHGMANPKAAP